MKRYVMFILLIIIVLVQVGCRKTNQFQAEIIIIDEGSDRQFDKSQKEIVELVFWRPSTYETEDRWFIDEIEKINKLYAGELHITMESISRGGAFIYEDKINAAAASGGLPDIILVDGPNISYYAYQNILAPLDEYYTSDELSDFVPSIIRQGEYDDKLYALGICESTVVLFYNKELMEKAGIEPPSKFEDAWTWEEFYEVCKKLTNDEVYGTNLINDWGEWITYCFEQLWISNETDIISEEGNKAMGYLNSEEGMEVASYLQRMSKENLFNLKPTPTEFEEKKAATKIGGVWNIPNMENYPDLEWGITYFPYSKTRTSPSGSWALGITTNCTKPEVAVKVIKMLTSKESSIENAKLTNMLPTRKSAFEDMTLYDEFPFKILKEQAIQTAKSRPRTPIYPLLTEKFVQAMYDIMVGEKVMETLDEVAKIIDYEYDRYFTSK